MLRKFQTSLNGYIEKLTVGWPTTTTTTTVTTFNGSQVLSDNPVLGSILVRKYNDNLLGFEGVQSRRGRPTWIPKDGPKTPMLVRFLCIPRAVMCILFIKLLKAAKPGEFKLILASNRDEYFKRPGKNAHFWEEDSNIFGGRDMTENKEGGTWLAMSKRGRLGVLLNASQEPNPQKLGRGFLVGNFLQSPLTEREYLENLKGDCRQYNTFHLVTAVLGSQPKIMHFTNAGDCSNVTEFDNSVIALSNSPVDRPFRKVVSGKKRFEGICNEYGRTEKKEELLNELLQLLKWEERHYPDDVIDSLPHLPTQFKPNYSAVYVNFPAAVQYGTRTHTVILVDWENKVEFHEWTLKEPITPEHMEWTETHEKFNIETET